MSNIVLIIVFAIVVVLLFVVTITSNRIWYNKLVAQNRIWSDLCRRNSKDWIEMCNRLSETISETNQEEYEKLLYQINEVESQIKNLKNGGIEE